jgi:hypothetical protein
VIGVEINFNKEFYVAETLNSVDSLIKEVEAIDEKINPIVL